MPFQNSIQCGLKLLIRMSFGFLFRMTFVPQLPRLREKWYTDDLSVSLVERIDSGNSWCLGFCLQASCTMDVLKINFFSPSLMMILSPSSDIMMSVIHSQSICSKVSVISSFSSAFCLSFSPLSRPFKCSSTLFTTKLAPDTDSTSSFFVSADSG